MGLAGPKRRTKISSDPNNTSWSSRTDRFGHKILTSQGWTPGSYLGASNANHQEHYTAANASHIRVLLKDDNLGLGASRKREGAETFGLDQFSGLLGRLNGKTEETLGKEEGARRDVRLRLWADQRGGVRFVSAGFLVGDKVEQLKREEVERKDAEEKKRGKKRRADGKVKDAAETSNNTSVSVGHACSEEEVLEEAVEAVASDNGDIGEQASKRRRKEEKRKRKAERALRKEEKRLRRAAKEAKRREREGAISVTSASPSVQGTSGTSTPDTAEGNVRVKSSESDGPKQTQTIPRRMIRSRYIQQKRMAGLDPQALKEIFMIKTPS
ncbi:hypothetical protein BDZ85DRAFT_264821 [Elsinoe ampelina]|uniref:PinX1-related protein 1 n=1 Tax=Elsinoe ampelina TaxID=302913 RepID=A0A6A6G8Q6_9PEZI|nr:hypothetical protein BDZ85DRAFT_264821 [Elsinoe ampelina]